MLPIELRQWALRHHVGEDALADLSALLGDGSLPSAGEGGEARVQSQVRLAAPAHGMRLWRNNVGVLRDERGRPVRYGLGNDSPALNKRLKSADLIGWRRLLVTAQMVGATVAQFVSLECKTADWHYRGDEHEQAQQRWAALVAADGGLGRFVTGPGDLV
jgi:hypothetical protein